MAKKKKEEEEDAWLWMSRPFSPGAIPVAANANSLPAELRDVVTHYKFTAYPDPGTWLERGEHPHEGFIRAMKEYAFVALLDPTNIPEARVWSLALGVGYGAGMGVTLAKGLILGPPILALIDPQHRWAGGLDEAPLYQSIESDIKFGVELGWAASPANPSNW